MQIQNHTYNPNFGMAIKCSPVVKKYFNKELSNHSLAKLKILEREQKNNPFDVEVIYLDTLRKGGCISCDYGYRAKVRNFVTERHHLESPIKFIEIAVDYANKLNAKFSKVEK